MATWVLVKICLEPHERKGRQGSRWVMGWGLSCDDASSRLKREATDIDSLNLKFMLVSGRN